MILRIIDQAVVGKYDSLRTPLVSAQCVDIALRICPAVLHRQKSFIVAEMAAADAFAWSIGFQGAARPTQFFCFFFCYKINKK